MTTYDNGKPEGILHLLIMFKKYIVGTRTTRSPDKIFFFAPFYMLIFLCMFDTLAIYSEASLESHFTTIQDGIVK